MAEKVKIGIIGAGIWGRNHTLALATHPRGSIELICDRNETRARAAKRLDGEHRLITLEGALRRSMRSSIAFVASTEETVPRAIFFPSSTAPMKARSSAMLFPSPLVPGSCVRVAAPQPD